VPVSNASAGEELEGQQVITVLIYIAGGLSRENRKVRNRKNR
jgi:hypothetical protein